MVVKFEDVAAVLRRYLQGELSGHDVREWAEAIECRDDLDTSSGMIQDLLFHLSTPEINGPLNESRARELLAKDGFSA